MKITKFAIELDNPARSFFAGQQISGKVVVVSKKEKKIESLLLKCSGKAKVRWTDSGVETSGKGGNRKGEAKTATKTAVFQAEEEYFNYEISLIGNGNSKEKGSKPVVPSGTSTHPFTIVLPHGLPSSYVGKSGQVCYQLQASLERKGKPPLTSKLPFTVNGILDLNKEPGALQPAETRKYKYLCCLFCRSGPIGFVFHISKKGFVPGERLKFAVELNNQSSRKVKGLSMALVQNVAFHARGNSMRDTRVIRTVKGPAVEPGGDDVWSDYLKIPPIPPSRLANCRIIDVQYALQIEMDLSGIAVNLRGDIPIIIGTIPLRQNFDELTQEHHAASMNVGIQAGDTISQSQPQPQTMIYEYPDLPPPSYAQAMASDDQATRSKAEQPNYSYKAGAGSKTSLNTLLMGAADDPDDFDLSYVPTYVTYG